MENEWSKVKLVDIIQFNPKESIKKGEIAKKVAMEKLEPFTRKISGFEEAKFTSGSKFRNGDTLLARITPCLENGKTAQVDILDKDEIGFGSTEYIVLREKLGITDNDFIYYLSISPEFRNVAIKAMNGSSGRQRVQKDVLENSEFLLPPLDEQKAIAKILSDLDEKIETNNKINKKLEEMAQAIFKQWFIDFEFPNEDGKPYKSSGGEMVESELGMIPKGWETKKMEEVCVRINSGGTPSRKKEEYYGGDIPWLKTKELLDNFIFNSEEYITEKGLKESSAKVFPRNTVLMAIYASPTVGKLGIASSDVTFNQAMCGMVTNENMLCYEYLYLFLLKERINLNNLASGSAQQNLSVTTIKNYTILVPNIELIKQFKNVISNAFIKIENNSLENIRLSNIRDSILPKLMSGEIRVPID